MNSQELDEPDCWCRLRRTKAQLLSLEGAIVLGKADRMTIAGGFEIDGNSGVFDRWIAESERNGRVFFSGSTGTESDIWPGNPCSGDG